MKLKTDNIFFVSDPHFFHQNVIKYCNRPFETVEEMNSTMIENWNKKVCPNDSIFLLGDVSFAKPEFTETILKQLNGNIYLVKGNHDWNLRTLGKYFCWEKDLVTIEVPDETIQGGYRPVVLCHYPLMTWDRMRYGSIQLFGHVHEKWEGNNRQMNVGVDVNNFTPISYKEVLLKLKTLPPKDTYLE
jgi:calcineurin-like phosphoesterase family protein